MGYDENTIRKFGRYGHVQMSMTDIKSMWNEFTDEQITRALYEVDKQVEDTGEAYPDYLAAIRNQILKDIEEDARKKAKMVPIKLTDDLIGKLKKCIRITHGYPFGGDAVIVVFPSTWEAFCLFREPDAQIDDGIPVWRCPTDRVPDNDQEILHAIEKNVARWNETVRNTE